MRHLTLGVLCLAACSASSPSSDPAPDPGAPAQAASPAPPPSAPKKPNGGPTPPAPSDDQPAQVPPAAPSTCDGMGGKTPTAVAKAPDTSLYPLQPTLSAFTLGAGYRTTLTEFEPIPLFDVGTVATGETAYGTSPTTLRSTAGLDFARATIGKSSFDSIFPDDIAPAGVAYNGLYQGAYQPLTWADDAAGWWLAPLGKTSVAFYEAVRVDAGSASLLAPTRGPDWSGDPEDYVSGARYTQYFAFAFHVIFDSTCKRDTYLSRAGANTLDALLPASDTKGLGSYLVDAKATVAVYAIALGQAAATQTVLDGTKCATDKLGECRALVQSLDGLAKSVGNAPVPTTFKASAAGNGDWFVEFVRHTPKSSL